MRGLRPPHRLLNYNGRTGKVTISIDQPDARDARRHILPGMLLRIRIVTERHLDALVVPKRALLREGESYFVFVAENGIATRVRVKAGFADSDFTEVIAVESGALTAGAPIVVVGNRDLEDGDRVEAAPWKSALTPDAGKDADASGADDDA